MDVGSVSCPSMVRPSTEPLLWARPSTVVSSEPASPAFGTPARSGTRSSGPRSQESFSLHPSTHVSPTKQLLATAVRLALGQTQVQWSLSSSTWWVWMCSKEVRVSPHCCRVGQPPPPCGWEMGVGKIWGLPAWPTGCPMKYQSCIDVRFVRKCHVLWSQRLLCTLKH